MTKSKKRNQIFTKSYVIKRLVESKFYVKHLIDEYPRNDSRYWTILINPNRHDIFLTCVRSKDLTKTQFRVYSRNDANILVETESLNVLLSVLFNLTNPPKNEQSEHQS